MSRYTGRGVIVLVSVVLGLFVASLPAGATRPGVNGQIAWDNPNGNGGVLETDEAASGNEEIIELLDRRCPQLAEGARLLGG